MRRHGLTVDNLVSVELVTAEGDHLHVDDDNEPELFWALRGGGGNFGVVSSFTFRLHPVGPMVFGGLVLWSIDDAQEVFEALDHAASSAPDELGMACTLRLAPPLPMLPPERVGTPVVGVLLVWSGDPAEAPAATAPLRGVGNPIIDGVKPTPYLAIQSMLDAGNPHGLRYYWRSRRVERLSGPVGDALVDAVGSITSPMSYVAGLAIGGAAARVAPDATAVGPRKVGFELNAVAAWPGPGEDEHRTWVRTLSDRLEPHASGVFSHFLSDEGDAGVAAAFAGRMDRLRAVKDRIDPTNFFRLNANIRPSAQSGPKQRSVSS